LPATRLCRPARASSALTPGGSRPAVSSAGLLALLALLCLAGLLARPSPVLGAGMDCAKAKTPVERRICADPALREADGAVAATFAAALAAAPDPAALRAAQRQWLAERNACPDAACLRDSHEQRRTALLALAGGSAPGTPAVAAKPAEAGDARTALLAERAALRARLGWPDDCEASFQETYAPDGVGLELLTSGVDHYDLGQGRTLYLIQCDQAAYQGVYVAMATLAGDGPARLLRFPTADAAIRGGVAGGQSGV
ncbi:MAG: lysozyme inhibitor LprI family protein, partial [Acidobacteriota bacterium]